MPRNFKATGGGGRAGSLRMRPAKLQPAVAPRSGGAGFFYTDVVDIADQVNENTVNIAINAVDIEGLKLVDENLQQQIHDNWETTVNLIKQRMRWLGNWTQQLHKRFDTVRDGAWTMVANKDTEGRPAPQFSGSPQHSYPDVPVWDIPTPTHVGVVHSGQTYTFSAGGAFRSMRVWIPVVTSTADYHLVVENRTDPNNITFQTSKLTNIVEGGWTSVGTPSDIINAGSTYRIYIDAYDAADNVEQFSDGWTFTGNDNNIIPAAGEWNTRTNNVLLRINGQSLGGNYDTQIANSAAGSDWRIQDSANPDAWIEYRQDTAVTSVGSDHEFNYTVLGTGAAGQPVTGAACLVTLTSHTAAATEAVELTGQWSTQPFSKILIEGYATVDGGPNIAHPDDGYGVDIEVEKATVSPDWDLIAYNQGFAEAINQPVDIVTYNGETVTFKGNTVVHNI